MTRQNRKWIALPGMLLCLLLLGFSDTARAQTVTLSGTNVSNNVLSFPNVTGGAVSSPQTVHVSTTSDPSTVIIQINNQNPWLQIDHTGSVNTDIGGLDLHVTINASVTPQNPTGLSQGSHTGTVAITMNGFPATQQILTVNVLVTGGSVLYATPPSLSFTAQVGTLESNIPTQTVAISSTAQQLNYTVSAPAGSSQSWLVAFTSTGITGGSGITIGVNPAGLINNVYTGSLIVQSTTSSDSLSITVTLTLTPATALSVTPTIIPAFLYQLGSNPPSSELTQNLMVSSTNASATFTVSVSPPAPWLTISPVSSATGTNGQAVPVRLSVNPGGLPSATYTTQLMITPVNGISLTPIVVQLVVSANPLLSINQNTLSFTSTFGGGSPPPSQPVQVSTLNNGPSVPFTYSSDSSWLTVTAPNGLNTPVIINISANPASLAVGTYTGTIKITPNNTDANLYYLPIAVTLTVGNSSQLTVGPPLVLFSYQIGKAVPLPQNVQVQSYGQPVQFNVSASSATAANCPSNWLSALAGGTTIAFTPATVTVTPTVASPMPTGSCTGTITISYPAGSLSPTNLTIPVTLNTSTSPLLNISMPSGFGVLTAPAGGSITSPAIALTSTDPATQVSFSVSASSSGPSTWLTVGSNGNLTPQNLTPQISAASLPPNVYAGTVNISSGSLPSGPVTIPINLTVTPSITVTAAPLTLTFNQAQNGPLPVSQNVNLTSSATGANFQVSIPNQPTCSWLQVTPTSGAASGAVVFAVQQNTLPQNSYACPVTLSFLNAATASSVVTATLVVGPPQTITPSPTSLSFNYQLTGAAPASQPLALSSNGGPVNFTATATSTGNWLAIDITSGATPKTINVSINPANIPAGSQPGGTLTGTVNIAAPGVLSTPLAVGVSLSLTAAPIPQPAYIVNSATSGFGSIAPGELIAIKGTGLGPTTPASFTLNGQGGLNSTLAGVQVLFGTIPGTPIYVSATQINVIVPYEINGQTTTNVSVVYNTVQSAPIPQGVAPVAPGIFTMNATGAGQASVSNQNYSINGPPGGVTVGGAFIPTTPATQGSVIAVYMTGGGQTNPLSTTGSVSSLVTLMPLAGWTPTSGTVTASIGGVPAKVTFAGAAPGEVTGVIQVNVQVPTGVSGNALSLIIAINGVSTGGGPTIAVQ
ncbi:MAG TPA: hypothetical protein VKR43_05215 [Bryobacteraceae bacterium]|nr:hypothetical protein [Bryobacteraceae bacterium]